MENGQRPATLWVGHIPDDSNLVALLDELDLPFHVSTVEGIVTPELFVDGVRYRGEEEIRELIEQRKAS